VDYDQDPGMQFQRMLRRERDVLARSLDTLVQRREQILADLRALARRVEEVSQAVDIDLEEVARDELSSLSRISDADVAPQTSEGINQLLECNACQRYAELSMAIQAHEAELRQLLEQREAFEAVNTTSVVLA